VDGRGNRVASRRQASPSSPHRIFISHLHRDDSLAIELRRLLHSSERAVAVSLVLAQQRLGPTDTADTIKTRVLIPRLRWMSTMAVLLTPQVSASSWVKWEIDFAVAGEKQVLGVRCDSTPSADLAWFLGLGHPVAEWSAREILEIADRRRRSSPNM